MNLMQFRLFTIELFGLRFNPSLFGAVLTACCIALFIKFGFWQYHKAEQKQALQDMYDQYLQDAPIALPDIFEVPEQWRYRKVKLDGEYFTQYQILLDNQVEDTLAGYHVITPVMINPNKAILVDRGWIPASDVHTDIPDIQTPKGIQTVSGQLWLPSTKIYSLESADSKANANWHVLWQHMDMEKYIKQVPFEVMPMIIRLDADSKAGGYIRNWLRPAERITTHIGYAYQWFGFAVAAFIIFLVVSTKK